MHELVIVLSDLYLSQDASERELAGGIAVPGLEHIARFGTRAPLAGGWRPWLARWLCGGESCGGDELATEAPATIAAAALTARGARRAGAAFKSTGAAAKSAGATSKLPSASAETPGVASTLTSASNESEQPIVWIATPVHLVAGLTSLHLDRRSILRLPISDLSALASEFQRIFHDSGFRLEPLDSGDFLLFGPRMALADTDEPARTMGESVAEGMRGGTGATTLRRLGAEIEMWLHNHPVNDSRAARGEPPITGLWLWGGGPAPEPQCAGTASPVGIAPTAGGASSDIAFGTDAYLQGLCARIGGNVLPVPQQLADVFGYPQAQRAVLVVQVAHMLHSNPKWTFFDAAAQIDRRFVAPAVEALRRGVCGRLLMLANDHQMTLRASSRLKVWRRALPGLSGLQ